MSIETDNRADIIYVVVIHDEMNRWDVMAFKYQYNALQYVESEKAYWAANNKNLQGEVLPMTKSYQIFEYNQGNPVKVKKTASVDELAEQNIKLMQIIESMKSQFPDQFKGA